MAMLEGVRCVIDYFFQFNPYTEKWQDLSDNFKEQPAKALAYMKDIMTFNYFSTSNEMINLEP